MAADYSPEELAHMQSLQAAAQPAIKTPTRTVTQQEMPPVTQSSTAPVAQPIAAPVDLGGMSSQVSSGYGKLKQESPSVVDALDTSMPWLKYAVGALGAASLASHFFGGEKQEKPSKLKERSIIKVEPQMDTSVRQPDGRIEPTLDVVEQNIGEKPTIPTAEQATQQIVSEGKIKTGKSGGGISPQEATILGNVEAGKAAADVEATVGKAPPKTGKKPVAPKIDESGLTKEQASMKRYLVSQYGGGPEGETAYKKVGEILGYTPAYEKGQGGGLSKEANDAIKAWRKQEIAGPKVNLTHDMKKVMKGAGGIAALAAIPGFAEAAQRKDFGAMTDIATDFAVLPFAQSREAGIPKAQEESLIAQKFKEAQKLGSPYRSVPPPK